MWLEIEDETTEHHLEDCTQDTSHMVMMSAHNLRTENLIDRVRIATLFWYVYYSFIPGPST